MVTGDDTPAGGIDANGFGPFEDQLTDEQQTVRVDQRDGRHVHADLQRPDDGAARRSTRPRRRSTPRSRRSRTSAPTTSRPAAARSTRRTCNVFFRRTFASRTSSRPRSRPTATGLTGTTPTVATATRRRRAAGTSAPTGDDRRSTLNTNDLRGKILRIKVKDTITRGRQQGRHGTARRLHDPGGQPATRSYPAVAAGDRRSSARDLRDGLPQPVPDPGRRERRRLRHATTRPDSQTPQRSRGPSGVGRYDDRPPPVPTTASR